MTSILCACASIATGQDIRWKSERATPGDYVTIDQSQGGLIHHVFRGKTGNSYITDSNRGPEPKGTPVFTTYTDKDGNYLRWIRSDGYEIQYQPHDCTRTLGQCTYTEVYSDGTRKERTRITQATNNGFRYQEFDQDGQFMFGGKIKLDAWGWAGNGTIDGYKGKQRFRLIKRSYQ